MDTVAAVAGLSDNQTGLVDSFGRTISYVRMSVTDRCDLRCRYCMAEQMQFLPRREILSLEEIAALADIFIARGVRKIRLTGGEPFVRRGMLELAAAIGARIGDGLDELTVTTNGTRLEHFAAASTRPACGASTSASTACAPTGSPTSRAAAI